MKASKSKINKIIVSGPSGCGKSTLINILEGAMESRYYSKYRVRFMEKRTLRSETNELPTIKFTHPLGMIDFVSLMCKCAGIYVGDLDKNPKNIRVRKLKLALAFQDPKKSR